MQSIELVTGPSVWPLTVSEAKAHLRVDHSVDDTYIESLIKAATDTAERFQNRRYINQTWRMTMDYFPPKSSVIEIPIGPVSSITSIVYVDEDGNSQTWSASEYQVDTRSTQARIVETPDYYFPDTKTGQINAVTITFVVGYGAASSAVPENIKHAIRLIVGDMYNQREDTVIGNIVNEMPRSAKMLLWQNRIVHF